MTSNVQSTSDFAPIEVQEVWVLQSINYCGSSKQMKRINTIIDKYPEWFPWEHKYKSIPQEVHDAYYEEKYAKRDLELSSKDIHEQIKQAPVSFTIDSLRELFDKLYNYDSEQELLRQYKRQKDKELWDKHYSKYNLEYKE